MGKRVYPPKTEEKPKPRKRGSGAAALFFMGAVFTLFGIAEAVNPIPFHAGGGLGRYGQNGVTFSYNASQSSGFGVFFTLMGLVFLYWGYCAVRNSKHD